VGVGEDVAEVAGDMGGAAEHVSIADDRAADAGAQSEQESVAEAAGGAPGDFAGERGFGVVVGADGRVRRQEVFDHFAEEGAFEEVPCAGQAFDAGGFRGR
jgi:hypothetical protein